MKRSWMVGVLSCALLFSFDAAAGDGERKYKRDSKDAHRSHEDRRHHDRGDRSDRHRETRREHGHRDAYRDRYHRNNRYRDHRDHRYSNSRHRHYNWHHHKKYTKRHKDRHADYFFGGLILGSLGSYYHGELRHYVDRYEYGHRVSYFQDRFGDCYRVEHRRKGKVYVEVPRYKCY